MRSAVLLLFLQAGGFTASAAERALPTIARIEDVRALSISEARKQYPVKIHGVVTYVDMQADRELFVQDDTAGTFVFLNDPIVAGALRAGSEVDVAGVSAAGSFAPCITMASVKILGVGRLPDPIRPSFDAQLASRDDGQWARLRGVIRSGQMEKGVLLLSLVSDGETFTAIMAEFPSNWATSLIDARVSVTGVLGALFNERRQALGMKIFVPSGFITVLSKPPDEPFALPVSSIGSIGQFRPPEDMERRIHVRGTVTAIDPGGEMFISEGRENLEVRSASNCSARVGDLIDVVGFPASIGRHLGLQNSLCRYHSRDSRISSIAVRAEEILPSKPAADPSGYGFSAGMQYDLRLVRLEGTVLQSTHGPAGEVFTAAAGDKQFSATLPPRSASPSDSLEPGTRLQFTGVCLIAYDQYRRAQSFRILLRDRTDLKVVSRPPWWNAVHALWVLALALVCFLASITWVSVLRARVAKQTLQLRQANETLQLLSSRDGLTGAANRRKFDETLSLELARASRSNTPVSLLMLDVDHFKALNDSYGHQRGDECLVQIVRVLECSVARATDLVARYGGEEFAILLPGTGRKGALAIAERIRTGVEELSIPNAGAPDKRIVTVSVGVAVARPSPDIVSASLIESADQALYESKSRGRNRVSFERAESLREWETAPS